jgi:hypothetical protein
MLRAGINSKSSERDSEGQYAFLMFLPPFFYFISKRNPLWWLS